MGLDSQGLLHFDHGAKCEGGSTRVKVSTTRWTAVNALDFSPGGIPREPIYRSN
jgi:hypothetical protein